VDDHADFAVVVAPHGGRVGAGTEVTKEIVELVEALHGGGRVIGAGGERSFGDVDELAQPEADVLLG
jgi:hypothetical protein